MKKVIIGSFLVLMSIESYAQYFPVDTLKLNSAHRNLLKSPNTPENQIRFFDAFPATWAEFIMTYQFISCKGYDLTMYNLAQKQIEALQGKLTLIPDSIYCKKIVNIAIGAKWDADAPSHFQELLHYVMWKKTESMFKELASLRVGHQMQFWQFYWSNIVKSKPLETEFERLKKLNEDLYPKQIEIMSIAFKYFYDGVDVHEDYPSCK